MPAKILIGADIVPTKSNRAFFESGNMDECVSSDLIQLLASADYRIFNLEVPVTDEQTAIDKYGHVFRTSRQSLAGLKTLGVDLVTLANNHMLDQGEAGLHSTMESLTNVGIAYTGVGQTPDEAARAYIAEIGEYRVGVYAFSEHGFSAVRVDRAGVNAQDPWEMPDRIAALREQCDYVICLCHVGVGYFRYPSPEIQKMCRKLVDKGADLVVCQHSHCVGCQEVYRNGTIIYGQGNFLFDNSDKEPWQTGLLIEVILNRNNHQIVYHPLCKQGNGVRLEKQQEKQILADFYKRSEEIIRPGAVNDIYRRFCETYDNSCLLAFVGVDTSKLPYRILNRLFRFRFGGWLAKRLLKPNNRLKLQFQLECESRRELLTNKFR